MQVLPWAAYHTNTKQTVRRILSTLVATTAERELTHEMVEQAVQQAIPALAGASVEDDAYHFLITEIYAEYQRHGAVD